MTYAKLLAIIVEFCHANRGHVLIITHRQFAIGRGGDPESFAKRHDLNMTMTETEIRFWT